MPFIPGSNLLMVELFQRLDSQRIENTLYFQFGSAALLESGANALLGDILTWWDTEMAPLLVQSLSLVEVKGTDLTTETSEVFTAVPNPVITGDVADESLPANVAACVSFRTTARGRSNRGRNYVPGIPSNQVSINTMAQGFADSLADAYLLLQGVGVANGATWVVASRFSNGAPRVGMAVRAITSVVVTDLTVDSQRRRLPGRGA